jgi:hypothetical protein
VRPYGIVSVSVTCLSASVYRSVNERITLDYDEQKSKVGLILERGL